MSKYYEVINTVYVSEEENIVLTPGQIVEIEFDDVPNDWPCIIINYEMYDVAFDDDEFPMFFKEIDN